MASENNAVLIYDIPSRDGKTWSHHVLRVLFAVHYKGIPYSIEGVEYPDITATFAPTALEPKNDPLEPYEIPVLVFQTPTGSPRYCMDPVKIIEALEELKPEPSLLYTSARSVEFRSRFGPAFAPVLQLTVGHVPQVLSERSIGTFAQKRRDRWGKPIEQWIAEHPVKDGLALAKPRFEEFGDWLEQTPGPFVNGEQPGYADFAVASFLGFVKAVGLKEAFESLLAMHPAVHRLYYAVKLTQLGNDRCGDLFEAPVQLDMI